MIDLIAEFRPSYLAHQLTSELAAIDLLTNAGHQCRKTKRTVGSIGLFHSVAGKMPHAMYSAKFTTAVFFA